MYQKVLFLKSQLPIFSLRKNLKFKVYGTVIYYKNIYLNNKINVTNNCYYVLTGLKTDSFFFNSQIKSINIYSYFFNLESRISKWKFNKLYNNYFLNIVNLKNYNNIRFFSIFCFNFLKNNYWYFNNSNNYFLKLIKTNYILEILNLKNITNITLFMKNLYKKNKKYIFLTRKVNWCFFYSQKKFIKLFNNLVYSKILKKNFKNFWLYFFYKKYANFGLNFYLYLLNNFIFKNNHIYIVLLYIYFLKYKILKAINFKLLKFKKFKNFKKLKKKLILKKFVKKTNLNFKFKLVLKYFNNSKIFYSLCLLKKFLNLKMQYKFINFKSIIIKYLYFYIFFDFKFNYYGRFSAIKFNFIKEQFYNKKLLKYF